MSDTFERALADAAEVLQRLPRGRHETRMAREQFAHLKAAYPDCEPQLVAQPITASNDVDYDVLLSRSGAGTLSLTWRADNGVPWAPEHADHWASNFVLSVDASNVTIQTALLYLNGVVARRPRLMETLVNRKLIEIAIADAHVEVSQQDIEDAVDAFRTTQGLFTGAATQQWLDERQLSMDALREMVRDTVVVRHFAIGLTRDRIEPYFRTHCAAFDRVRVLRVENLSAMAGQQLADAWRESRTCPALGGNGAFSDCTARLDKFYVFDLGSGFADADEGAIVGPEGAENGGEYSVGQVLSREAAVLDAETAARIHDVLLDAWLAERRSVAKVQWHWV